MINKENNIEFLNKLSNLLVKKISPINTVSSINKLFREYMNIDKTEFVIWDNNNMLLKDFAQDWKIFDESNQEKSINYIYSNLAIANGTKFYFNEHEFEYNIDDDNQYKITELRYKQYCFPFSFKW